MDNKVLEELKSYINDNINNFENLKNPDLSDYDKTILLYEIYANFLDLEEDCKAIRSDMRFHFKIKDTEIKKWMASEDSKDDMKD